MQVRKILVLAIKTPWGENHGAGYAFETPEECCGALRILRL